LGNLDIKSVKLAFDMLKYENQRVVVNNRVQLRLTLTGRN